jgi:hypothetical protein
MLREKCIWIFTEVLGWGGAFLAVYVPVSALTRDKWMLIERWAPVASATLTLLGAVVTAILVYLPPMEMRAAWEWSRKLVAPLVIVGAIVSLGFLIVRHDLPPVLVSAFGLLAISGSVKRLLSLPKESK